eukprot:CAMPEP_0118974326 /NCGR_PEP_ID=MMETSP1173-20130426/11191_1 /TAXON_ID=1034831 /ORGANISM="Rhizochromulina marina cf, Strain CCMP1243" /LENGTH=344 /DNA_ID=CAMNT_0006924043 /DNA_START=9 /DNA_END=1043 /DNA_ORIENTATION=-
MTFLLGRVLALLLLVSTAQGTASPAQPAAPVGRHTVAKESQTCPSSTPQCAGHDHLQVPRGGGLGGGIFQQFREVVVNARGHLVAGAAARAVSIFAMYPVDTIKTRLQMGGSMSGLQVGLLYKGLFGSLVGQIPYGTLTFGSYEVYKETLAARFPSMALGPRSFLAAVLGDLTGSIWLCPSEVVKQQLQGGVHANLGSAINAIWKSKGLSGFYQGYAGQIARDVPFRAVQLVSYELTKQTYLNFRKKDQSESQQLEAWEGAIVGAVAGSFSAAVTTPLDVLKTRLMTGSAYGATGVIRAARLIAAKESPAALFKGMVPRVVYVGPSCAIFFMVYELVHRNFEAR